MLERLKDKVVVVTGAGSGLGRAASMRFAAEGAAVVCTDVADSAHAVADALTAEGHVAIGVEADVTSPAALDAMVVRALDQFGRIDVLYANAGVSGAGGAAELDPEAWERTIMVNLTGVFLSARAVLPAMIEQRSGCIINQASVAGLIALPVLAAYSAAKAGVIGLTRQMALDYGPAGVRVNAICPGTVVTPLVEETFEHRARGKDVSVQEALATAGESVPLGRLGEPGDVAALAAFLASDEANWITGAIHTVDGGLSLAPGAR